MLLMPMTVADPRKRKFRGVPESATPRRASTHDATALETVKDAKPRVVHDHGSEFVNRDFAAVIKTHNLIDIKTKPRHPESNGVVERFNGTVRDESDNDYGRNYLQAEAIIAKLMHHYNARRTHQALDYQTPDDVYYGGEECRLGA